jgi:hypothetical protein
LCFWVGCGCCSVDQLSITISMHDTSCRAASRTIVLLPRLPLCVSLPRLPLRLCCPTISSSGVQQLWHESARTSQSNSAPHLQHLAVCMPAAHLHCSPCPPPVLSVMIHGPEPTTV